MTKVSLKDDKEEKAENEAANVSSDQVYELQSKILEVKESLLTEIVTLSKTFDEKLAEK